MLDSRNLPEKIYAFTEENALFTAPCHVLVGVSGGGDSMALLHCLMHWKMPGLQISVVHVHHGLRGEAADRDAEFVQEFCHQHRLDCHLLKANVALYAKEEHLSVEDAGRRLRYHLFEQLRQDVNAEYILTAHTESDQAETILMHIVRGCGTDGLCGIPASRGVIRRPLLCCNRHEIEAYCTENHIPYVTDESNTDTHYTRNRIRHELLPILRTYNPSVDEALVRLSAHAGHDSAYLNNVAQDALDRAETEEGYDSLEIAMLPQPIRRRCIRLMMSKLSVPTIEESHIHSVEQLLCSGLGSASLPGGIIASVGQGRLYFHTAPPNAVIESLSIDSFPFTSTFGTDAFTLELQTDIIYNLLANTAVDYDKIQGKLYIRCREAGDYLHPANRHIGKSLKKLMNEWHIPAYKRDVFPVLCDDIGIVLVPGYACDERVRPTSDTKHFLVWRTISEQG